MHINPYQPPVNVTAAPAGGEGFHCLAFVLRNVFLPSLLGGIAVVSVIPINFAAFAGWLSFLASNARRQLRQQRPGQAASSTTIQVAVVAAIVTAAHIAPVKTTDRLLDRLITLPKAQMTLGELEGDLDGLPPEWRFSWVRVSVPDDERPKVIAFPDTTMTMRQFVGAIESQSTVRHRFAHCGNGWTILWGGDCSFGMDLRRPPSRTY
jgi:hypothetical protein